MTLMGRYRIPSEGRSIQRAGGVIADVGLELLKSSYNSQITMFKAEDLEERNKLDLWLDQNPFNTDEWETKFEKEFWPHYKEKVEKNKTGQARKEISMSLPAQKQVMIAHIRQRKSQQERINNLAAKDTLIAKIKNTDFKDGVHLTEVSSDVLGTLMNLYLSGDDPELRSEQAVYEKADEIMSLAVMRFIMSNPHKTDEKGNIIEEDYWVNHPNELAEEYEINSMIGRPLFTDKEITQLKSDYQTKKNSEIKLANDKIRNAQQDKEIGFYLRMTDPEVKNPVTATELNQALANREIDLQAHKDLSKLLTKETPKEDDDEALLRVNDIFEQVEKGEITWRKGYDQIKQYKTKLITTTYQNLIEKLPDAETLPEQWKIYFDTLKEWRKSKEISILGKDNIEQNLNYNRYVNALMNEYKKNPNIKPEQIDKIFRAIVSEPIAKNWYKKILPILYKTSYPGIYSWAYKTAIKGEVTEKEVSQMTDDELMAIIKGE